MKLNKNFHERLYVQHTKSSRKKSIPGSSVGRRSISPSSTKVKKNLRKKSRTPGRKRTRSAVRKKKGKSKSPRGRSRSKSAVRSKKSKASKGKYNTVGGKYKQNPHADEHEYYHNLQKKIKTPRAFQDPSNYNSGISQQKIGPVGKFIDQMRNVSYHTTANNSPQGCFKSAGKNQNLDNVDGFYVKKKSKKSKLKKIHDEKPASKQTITPVSETSKSTKLPQSTKRRTVQPKAPGPRAKSPIPATPDQQKPPAQDPEFRESHSRRRKTKMSREGSRQKTVPGNSFIDLLDGEDRSINVSHSKIQKIEGVDRKYSQELDVKEEHYRSEQFKQELIQEAQETIDKLVSDTSDAELEVLKNAKQLKEDLNVQQEAPNLKIENSPEVTENVSLDESLTVRNYFQDIQPILEKPIAQNFPMEQPDFIKPQIHPPRIAFNSIPQNYIPKVKDIVSTPQFTISIFLTICRRDQKSTMLKINLWKEKIS